MVGSIPIRTFLRALQLVSYVSVIYTFRFHRLDCRDQGVVMGSKNVSWSHTVDSLVSSIEQLDKSRNSYGRCIASISITSCARQCGYFAILFTIITSVYQYTQHTIPWYIYTPYGVYKFFVDRRYPSYTTHHMYTRLTEYISSSLIDGIHQVRWVMHVFQ